MINYCLYYDRKGTLLAYKLTGENPTRASRSVERSHFLDILGRHGIKDDITEDEKRIDPEAFQAIMDFLMGIIKEVVEPPPATARKGNSTTASEKGET